MTALANQKLEQTLRYESINRQKKLPKYFNGTNFRG